MTVNPGATYVRGILPYPFTPALTVYTPGSAAYTKVTPSSEVLELIVRPRVTTEALIYAPLITHKIADAGTDLIAAADATTLASSKTLADEMVADCNTHKGSTTYHVAAGAVIVPGHKAADTTDTIAAANMSDLGTGYTLADELCTDFATHCASTTYHLAAEAYTFPGTPNSEPLLRAKVNALRTAMLAHYASTAAHSVADAVNLALVTATTPGSDQASDQTLINLLKTYHTSHIGIGAAAAADLAAVVAHANALRAGLLAHFASTTVHGGAADATNIATLTAVAVASDQATANTLLTAEKATYNAHCAVVDGGAYVTAGPGGMPLSWFCRGSFFAKTDAAGVFTVAEFKSAP